MTSGSPGDWRSSFGYGPGQQAGSLMVAVPPGQQAVHSVSGAGANAASAFILPTVSARGVSDAQMTKWKIAFQNLCALQSLRVVVQEGKPTKYLTFKVWTRHLHYTHNMSGEPPPPVDKPSKKGPSAAKVLSAKDKATLLLVVQTEHGRVGNVKCVFF